MDFRFTYAKGIHPLIINMKKCHTSNSLIDIKSFGGIFIMTDAGIPITEEIT